MPLSPVCHQNRFYASPIIQSLKVDVHQHAVKGLEPEKVFDRLDVEGWVGSIRM